jgi:hypothetical protein
METRFISLGELARATQIPTAWLKRESDAGRLPCIRAGKMLRFDLAAVVRYLTDRSEREASRAK